MQETLGVIRHALTAAGGGLIANGTITDSDLQAIVGGVIAVLGVAWSIYQKRQAKA